MPEAEEDVYATLPYLLAKTQVTRELLAARAEGASVMVGYLVTPWGPFSREDDACDVAKLHRKGPQQIAR